MTTRRIVAAIVTLATLGCAASDAPPARPKRVTIVPAPGTIGAQLARDGRLAYGRIVDGKSAIFVSDADGRHARRVSFGAWDFSPIWSPDGKFIAFHRELGAQIDVIIVPSDSGAERIVAATPANELPAGWFPDGGTLLFWRNTNHGVESWAYRMSDGSSTKQIEADGSVESYPSPDGKWLAYSLTNGGKTTIWLWDRAKKTARPLTTEGFEKLSPDCFSPDSRSVLYASSRTGTGDLWRVDIATGARTQITQDVADDYAGKWSPDGLRILFNSNRGGQPDLWMTTPNGERDVQRVTDDATGEFDAQWTPDSRAVIVSVTLGEQHLYRIPLAGDGTPVALTSGDWYLVDAEVSPDGQRVAYSGTRNGDEDVWVVPAAGGESKLVSGAPGSDRMATWTPDGKQIAFSSARSGNADIWIAPLEGGTAVRLTDWPSEETMPRVSPDGKTIAFFSNRESAGRDLWTMPLAGGAATRLTKMGSLDYTYRWSPDGKTIAFSAEGGGAKAGMSMFLVPSSGGAARPFAPPTSSFPEWKPDGRELKLAHCEVGHPHCTVEIWSADGKRLRSLSQKPDGYEFELKWSKDGTQGLVGWSDTQDAGAIRVDLRAMNGGASKTLAHPAGSTMQAIGFADSDRSAIVMVDPLGTALQRIEVPALAPLAKR